VVDIVWDMETGDPDDFLTLLLLLGHPEVNLKAVTVTPGGADQIGLVKWIMGLFQKEDIPVGSFWNPEELKQNDIKQHGSMRSRVSRWHNKVYSSIMGDKSKSDVPYSYESEEGWKILRDNFDENTTLVTGAPLKNLGALLDNTGGKLGRLVAQGGFAGEGVVPEERQLEKFKGMVTCPTYNLNGDPRSALKAIESDRFTDKYFVSKNVCHGVYYNRELHNEVIERSKTSDDFYHLVSLCYIIDSMDIYFKKNAEGKKFHDPLAACCAIDLDIGMWSEVELYREKGKWGSRLCPGSGTKIVTGYNHDRFVDVLLDRGGW
jgi:inosine-uridine nucleoside N-ribohydrolase